MMRIWSPCLLLLLAPSCQKETAPAPAAPAESAEKTREQLKSELKAEMRKELEKEQLRKEAAKELEKEIHPEVEARINLRKIYDSAAAYYLSERSDDQGNILPHQFPASAPATPPESCCGSPPAPDATALTRPGKCRSRPADWNTPTWAALSFSIDEPMFYRYDFTSSGVGAKAQFRARAYGDPGCKGDGPPQVWEIAVGQSHGKTLAEFTSAKVRVRQVPYGE